jgi:hypothetical protein
MKPPNDTCVWPIETAIDGDAAKPAPDEIYTFDVGNGNELSNEQPRSVEYVG